MKINFMLFFGYKFSKNINLIATSRTRRHTQRERERHALTRRQNLFL